MERKKHLICGAPSIYKRRDAANIALIGGIDRLKKHYIDEAGKFGINLRVFNRPEANIGARIQNLDAVIIFTNKVSHLTKWEAVHVAKSRNIAVLMCHSCGICSLRNCFTCLMNKSYSSAGL